MHLLVGEPAVQLVVLIDGSTGGGEGLGLGLGAGPGAGAKH